MKLTTTTQVPVDGVAQGNGGPDENRSGGFERGGWARPLFDSEAMTFVNQVYQGADAFLFGPTDLRAFRRLLGRAGRSGEPHRRFGTDRRVSRTLSRCRPCPPYVRVLGAPGCCRHGRARTRPHEPHGLRFRSLWLLRTPEAAGAPIRNPLHIYEVAILGQPAPPTSASVSRCTVTT